MSVKAHQRSGARTQPEARGFQPVRILEVELSEPIAAIEPRRTPAGLPYCHALALVRLHDVPLALARLSTGTDGLSAAEFATALWSEVAVSAGSHLGNDGLEPPNSLDTDGLRAPHLPRCSSRRAAFLASDPPELSVLIPTRDRPKRLARCLDSVLDSAYPDDLVTIIVVDNAPSNGDTKLLVGDYASRTGRVRYVREDAPGSASARNAGLRHVQTEVVAMTDDDVLVDRHWLTEIARAFAGHPEAAAVSGLVVPMQLDTPAQGWFEQYGGFGRGFERRVFDLQQHRPPGEPLYPWNAGLFGTGNNFAFRTGPLRAIGAFDPALGNGTPALGGVDSEVLLRTILTGHQIVYEPSALVHHAHRADYESLRRQVYAYGSGLVAYYLKTLTSDPRRLADFVRRVPAGLRYMFGSGSHINQQKLDTYPRELTRLEWRGMLYGPLGYARSRRRYGRHRVPAS